MTMRRIRSVAEANQLMISKGLPILQPRREVRTGLGDYGEDDPNIGNHPVYSEREAFRGTQTAGQTQQYAPDQPLVRNRNSFTVYPFAINNGAAVTILPSNERRNFLLVQNQSTGSNLLVNFGADASALVGVVLLPGAGVFFDYVCPYNAVSVFMNSATNEPGCIVEGAPTQ